MNNIVKATHRFLGEVHPRWHDVVKTDFARFLEEETLEAIPGFNGGVMSNIKMLYAVWSGTSADEYQIDLIHKFMRKRYSPDFCEGLLQGS